MLGKALQGPEADSWLRAGYELEPLAETTHRPRPWLPWLVSYVAPTTLTPEPKLVLHLACQLMPRLQVPPLHQEHHQPTFVFAECRMDWKEGAWEGAGGHRW